MEVSISHIIGTVALVSLVVAAGFSYSTIGSYIEVEVKRKQLNQIAENVALNLVEIVNLVNFANFLNNQTMLKILNLPSDLPYSIALVNETDQGRGYSVRAEILGRNDIVGQASIPLNSTMTQVLLAINSWGTLQVRGEDAKTVQYSDIVYSGAQEIVVWGWRRDSDTTFAGIGVLKSIGGS